MAGDVVPGEDVAAGEDVADVAAAPGAVGELTLVHAAQIASTATAVA